MKQVFKILMLAIFVIATSCSHNDLYDDMPSAVQSFVSQYYPNSSIESVTSTSSNYTIILKNGPTLVFNTQGKWAEVNGNGSTLPQVLMFNDFPPVLYQYLQETENLNNVFSVTRNDKEYVVQLLKDKLTYDIATGEITGQETTPTGQS